MNAPHSKCGLHLACNGGSNPSLSASDKEEPRVRTGFSLYIIFYHSLSDLGHRIGGYKFVLTLAIPLTIYLEE